MSTFIRGYICCFNEKYFLMTEAFSPSGIVISDLYEAAHILTGEPPPPRRLLGTLAVDMLWVERAAHC